MEFLGKDYPAPELNFAVSGVEVECSPENTTLFTYRKVGATGLRLSMYDHLFYHDEEQDLALYGFLTEMDDERKEQLLITMLANGYNIVANQDVVAECDLRAFEDYVIKPKLEDLSDYHFPEEFFDD